jgi:hypothetical protein
MKPAWMDPDEPGPTALCVTDTAARFAHEWAILISGGGDVHATNVAAKSAAEWCGRCDVAAACLSFAQSFEGGRPSAGRGGVYGGLSPAERASQASDAMPCAERDERTPEGTRIADCMICGGWFETLLHNKKTCSEACKAERVRRTSAEHRRAKRAEATA